MIFKEIGYFSKTQGLKGQLQLNIIADFDIETCAALFIQLSSGQSPQFISEFRQTKNGFVISLEDIDTIDKAKPFVGKKVLIDEKYILESNDTNYVGYKLFDEKFGDLGLINRVEDSGANLVFYLTFKEKEVLLPFKEELVKKIDDSAKVIYYLAPEGLIDMYLA